MVPDFYTILGVDPTADTSAIEAALNRCQPAWASGTRNPKRKHEYQSYLDLIPEIRKTLLQDPNTRAAYDAERAAALRAERDRKLDELQLYVRLRAAKGGVSTGDRSRLEDRAQALGLTGNDLARLLHGVPALEFAQAADEPDEPDEPAPIVLDGATRRQIRVTLDHLKRQNLYDVLDLGFDASPDEVTRRADEERARWMQKAQVTAEKTAWLEAVSYAQTHLTTTEGRHRYDWTLIIEAEEAFTDLVAFTIDGLPRLDEASRSVLLDEAAARGLVSDRADRLIRRVCRAQGVGTGTPPTPTEGTAARPPRMVRCRSCGGLSEFQKAAKGGSADAGNCQHCGASLRWNCPICAQVRWVDQPRCACGFPLAQHEPLLKHFEAAQTFFRSRSYEAALGHLNRITEFAPKHRSTRKAIERVKEKLAEAERARHAFETVRAQRKLVAARAAFETWAKVADPSDPQLAMAREGLFESLRQALAMTAEARVLVRDDPTAARTLFHRALAIAADLAEAREGLRSCPLDPPSGLRAKIEGRRIHLSWGPPRPDGLGPIGFRVVRQTGRVPQHSRDGQLVAEVAEPEAFDDHPPSGELVGYAVFSRRDQTESMVGPTVGPILILAEVSDLVVEERDGEVELRWRPPAGAADVRLVRKLGTPPSGPDDGERLRPSGPRFVDRGLPNDSTYHYAIFALYRQADGKMRASRGLLATATPHPIIEGVGRLSISQESGGAVRLGWIRPPRGQVRILRSPRPLPLPYNARISSTDAANLPGEWLGVGSDDQAIDPQPPESGLCHYTPLTSWNGTLVVGKGAAFSCLPDPADLRAVRSGASGRVHLRWRWTPMASQTLVLLKSGSPADGPEDPDAQVFPVQESEYSRVGSYMLTLPPDGSGPWHLAVRGVAQIEGERVVSPGIDPTSRTIVPGPNPEITLSYSLKKPGFPGRGWTITLHTEPPGQPLPPLALVAHPRTVPLSIDDGSIVERYPVSGDGQSITIRPGPVDLSKHRLRLFPDLHAAPEGMPPVRMRHPEVEATRI